MSFFICQITSHFSGLNILTSTNTARPLSLFWNETLFERLIESFKYFWRLTNIYHRYCVSFFIRFYVEKDLWTGAVETDTVAGIRKSLEIFRCVSLRIEWAPIAFLRYAGGELIFRFQSFNTEFRASLSRSVESKPPQLLIYSKRQ